MQDVVKKMHFKGEGIVLNAPLPIEKQLLKLGFKTTLDKKGTNSNTLVFFNNSTELLSFLNGSLKQIEPDSVLWFAYPKGSSKIKTDINRDSISAAIALYPNPARGGLFYVSVPQELVDGPVWVSVIDQAGHTVYVTNLSGSGTVGHAFAAGVYFVRIRTGKVDVTKKLVVE